MGTFFATPWVSGSPIIHSDAAVPPATVGISTCTPSDASCTSRASDQDRDPWHAAETSYSNCVVPWALADRQCGALFLPPFECATLAPLLERWCLLSSEVAKFTFRHRHPLLRRTARLRPRAAIFAIRFLPYFFLPIAAATAAGLRAPRAAARRLIFAKRPPPPSRMDLRRRDADLRLAIFPPLSKDVTEFYPTSCDEGSDCCYHLRRRIPPSQTDEVEKERGDGTSTRHSGGVRSISGGFNNHYVVSLCRVAQV